MSLQDITARAGVLLKQIDGVLATPDVSNYGYVDEFKQLKDRVAEVRAESLRPARIGLVGGFSSGKTRTLEALLGLAGQLPVSESPSTGNIVELRMVRDEGVVETCLQNWRVKMMTEEDANGILRKLLDKARELCFLEDESLVAEMGANINPKAPWGGAAEFAKSTHPKALANKLKSVCFEICRLERVYNGGRRFIERKEGGQDGYDISLEQARNLMTLNYDPMDVSKPLADFDFSLDSIPDTAELSSLSGESLSKLFALVKKIEVEVHATPAVFDRFVSGGMQEFVFVDCPGYGADTSSVRDQALCEVELKNVDCIVVLLSARTPGNSLEFVDSANRTWKETVGDRMVAVVSRFDEIPFNDGGGKQLLSTLASDNAVTEEKVLSTFAGTLGTLWKFAERTASSDKKQICFFSAMAYIDSMLNRTPPISLAYCFALLPLDVPALSGKIPHCLKSRPQRGEQHNGNARTTSHNFSRCLARTA